MYRNYSKKMSYVNLTFLGLSVFLVTNVLLLFFQGAPFRCKAESVWIFAENGKKVVNRGVWSFEQSMFGGIGSYEGVFYAELNGIKKSRSIDIFFSTHYKYKGNRIYSHTDEVIDHANAKDFSESNHFYLPAILSKDASVFRSLGFITGQGIVSSFNEKPYFITQCGLFSK